MPLLSAPLVVLDTETTGFPRQEWSRVVELAAVLLDVDGKEVSSWSSLVKPDILDDRAAGALAVNHITPEMLEGQPDTGSAAMSFLAWLSSHGLPKITAFNVEFDCSMLKKMGLQVEWAPCVMLAAQKAMGVDRWPKLSAAAEHFNVPVEGDAHRALTDARTAARIVVAIQSKAKGLPMPVYDIIDRPGPLPDEEPKTKEKPDEKPWLLPDKVRDFAFTYETIVVECVEELNGAAVTIPASDWGRVCRMARKYDNLSSVSIRTSAGLVWMEADVYPDFSAYRILVKSTFDPSEPAHILTLSDLF